ncbi:MAG: hypothetical protein HYT72_00865 [Candidatus Aenigmarchaeota archaeon]|nr:hypothetical protein [Candidatus Aenigmarchaeota archaeon]
MNISASWERFKKNHPNMWLAIKIIWLILPIFAFFIRPYVDFATYPTSQLEHTLSGNNILGHISSYNLWTTNETINLIKGRTDVIDFKVQNKYEVPLLTQYDLTDIYGLEINLSYNGQSRDNPVSINSYDWNYFSAIIYVNSSAEIGYHKLCLRVNEAIKVWERNYQIQCVDISISDKQAEKQQE